MKMIHRIFMLCHELIIVLAHGNSKYIVYLYNKQIKRLLILYTLNAYVIATQGKNQNNLPQNAKIIRDPKFIDPGSLLSNQNGRCSKSMLICRRVQDEVPRF